MVVNALYYVMTIFVTIAIFLFIQEPYYGQLSKTDMGIANIQMENVKDYEIVDTKIVRITTAKESIKYLDRDLLHDVHVASYEKDFIYDVRSKQAEFKDEILTLKDDVVIKRSDDTTFKSQEISYDKNKNILYNNTLFEIKNPIYNANGSGFTYDLDKKSIIASNVHVDYKLEKK